MKFKTDFVTNSSSTSYIFEDKNLLSAKDTLRKRAETKIEKDFIFWGGSNDKFAQMYNARNIRWLNNCFEDELEWINQNLIRLKECEIRTLWEIFTWYREDIIEIIIYGYEEYRRTNRKLHDEDELINEIRKGNFSDDVFKKLFGVVALFYIFERFYDERPEIFTKQMIEYDIPKMLSEIFFWSDSRDNVIHEIISNYYDRMFRTLEDFVGLTAGEIFEYIIGICYVYYEEYETVNVLLRDALTDMPSCIFGCSHMG